MIQTTGSTAKAHAPFGPFWENCNEVKFVAGENKFAWKGKSVQCNDSQEHFPDESFFEMLMKCQGSRIEEQRTSLPNGADLHDPPLLHARNAAGNNLNKGNSADQPSSVPLPPHAPTVPDEDFFSLIQRLQGGRLEDQRAVLPTENTRNGNAAVPADKDVK